MEPALLIILQKTVKLSKKDVGFESPAKGPDHCGECIYFLRPDGCKRVAGLVKRQDWCKRFLKKSGA